MDATDPPDMRGRFVEAMSQIAATVNVVTTDGPAGRFGVTVSAMSAVSADGAAPTLLVCVHGDSPAAAAIRANGAFCVNVLSDDQSYISDTFAGRFKDRFADRFDCTDWTSMPSGAARVVDPLVAFDCRVQTATDVGTHTVFIGAVGDVFQAPRGAPLIYARRAYGSAQRLEPVQPLDEPDAAMLNFGCFKTFGPFVVPALVAAMAADPQPVRLNMIEGDQRHVQEGLLAGQTDVALLYDLDLSPLLEAVALTRMEPHVLLAADHPLAGRGPLALADLAALPMVLLNTAPSRDYFLGMFTDRGLVPRVAYSANSLEMVRGLVGHGLGFALLATRPAADVSYDGRAVTVAPLVDATQPSTIVMATVKGRARPGAVDRFAWLAQTHFALDA